MWSWVIAAGLAGLMGGCGLTYLLIKRSLSSCLTKIESLERYISPGRRLDILDEDHSGSLIATPSPLEAAIQEAVTQRYGEPKIRTRVLVEVPVSDPGIRRELMSLRERGDGQWLAIGLEKMMRDRRLNQDMLDLKRRTVPQGWTLASIEPAYDSGQGLLIWFEIERPIAGLKRTSLAA